MEEKKKIKDIIYELLLFLTNNKDSNSVKDEIRFDIGFFIVNTIFLITGGILLAMKKEIEWLPFLVIEYTWALDNMRHNR